MDVDEEMEPCKSGMFMLLSESQIIADDTDCADFYVVETPQSAYQGDSNMSSIENCCPKCKPQGGMCIELVLKENQAL